MTLFDPDPYEPTPPRTADIEPADVAGDGLACRAVGCTRPYQAHIVTLASVENAAHPPAHPPTTKRNRK